MRREDSAVLEEAGDATPAGVVQVRSWVLGVVCISLDVSACEAPTDSPAPHTVGPSGLYQRITHFRVGTTNADAAPMSKGAGAKLGYHDHYVVDGGKARIILAALVTPGRIRPWHEPVPQGR